MTLQGVRESTPSHLSKEHTPSGQSFFPRVINNQYVCLFLKRHNLATICLKAVRCGGFTRTGALLIKAHVDVTYEPRSLRDPLREPEFEPLE